MNRLMPEMSGCGSAGRIIYKAPPPEGDGSMSHATSKYRVSRRFRAAGERRNMGYPEVYAVDFDKTMNLAGKYPELGEPNTQLINYLIRRRAAGDKVILWTCREGKLLEDAVRYCRKYGLEFDAVNDNIQENKDRWGNNTRKVFADYYVDDKARMPDKLIIEEIEDE